MGLLDRFGAWKSALGILDYVNVKELGDVVPALQRVKSVYESTNWDDDAEIGSLIDASLYCAQQLAQVSKTTVDDEIVAAVTEISTSQRQWLVAAIKWLKANPESEPAVFFDSLPATEAITLAGNGERAKKWLALALEVWEFIRKFQK